MVTFCSVPLCHSRSGCDQISFHRFPSVETEPERRASWISTIRRESLVVKDYSCVCGKHSYMRPLHVRLVEQFAFLREQFSTFSMIGRVTSSDRRLHHSRQRGNLLLCLPHNICSTLGARAQTVEKKNHLLGVSEDQ